MESDDRTVSRIAFHVVQHLFRAHPLTVIAGHEIPHNDAVMIAQRIVLPESHVSVWWTEEIGMNTVSYTHLRAHETPERSRMPSSA